MIVIPAHRQPTCRLVIPFFLLFGLSVVGCNERSPFSGTPATHAGHDDHDDHGDHGDHGDHDDHGTGTDGAHHAEEDNPGHELHIAKPEQQEFGLRSDTAAPASITLTLRLQGELALNTDHVAHVFPRIPGVTHAVHKRVGDLVTEGELLAVLHSRELAQAKAQFLADLARERIAEAHFTREDNLWKEKITSERAFLDARQALDQATIARTLAIRELHALDLSEDDIASLPTDPAVTYTRYHLTAPIAGQVIQRHLVRGEMVKADSDEPIFVIADLDSVWLNLAVYADDLRHVHPGQDVTVAMPNDLPPLHGTIDYISPLIDPSTRTTTARVTLPNPDRTLRPGLFVTASLTASALEVPVAVKSTAIQTVDAALVVFVATDAGFTPVPVTIGSSDQIHTEIRHGLRAGDVYVVQGGFVLKSELQKSELEHAGHAH